MSQEEDAAELKRLVEELTTVLNTLTHAEEERKVVCEETLDKLKRLNVDVDVVRKIMKRADELKGKTENFRTSNPLFEEINRLIRE